MRRWLGMLACIGIVAALPLSAPAQNAEAIIHVVTGPNDSSLPLVYADKAGLFKRAGLNVDVSMLSATAVMVAALVGGSAQIAQGSSLGAIQILAKGLPLTLIGSMSFYNADDPNEGLIVAAGSSIKNPKDLEGKALGSVTLQNMNSLSTLMWLAERGVDTSTIKLIEIPASATLAALESNRIAAATVYEPFYSTFVASGKVRVIGHPFSAVAKHYTDAVMLADVKWAAEHRELVDRFLRVVQTASSYVAAHENETAPLMATFAGLDPNAIPEVHHPTRNVKLTPSDLQPVIDAAAQAKVIPKTFPAATVICSCALTK